jgi:hypothetical protein
VPAVAAKEFNPESSILFREISTYSSTKQVYVEEFRRGVAHRSHPRPHCDDSVSDRSAVNVTPLQLGQDVLWIHSARLDEALVTAAILPGHA